MQKKNIRDQFLSTLSLVCRIPIPFSFAFNVKRLDLWLPLTALFQSLLFGLSLSLFFLLFRSLELAVLSALAVYYGVFNLFHFDGLLDTADAFLGAFEREKRQEILKDPRLGVYAVFTGIIYIAAKILVLLSILNLLNL
ncbi:MAG TPA: adenosylcobinamide-GDP ribazoletransferase, partial [Treponema sp.]|nr:adenosylcobinamide-GDP ribazoletransferase [Treponema sp.]